MLAEGMLYLGTLSRFEDEQWESRLFMIHVVFGHGIQCAQFHTEQEAFHWSAQCSLLRDTIADLHAQKTAGLDEGTFLYQLRAHWLPSCDYFFESVGKEMVPPDIRHAYQDVRINVGFPVVSWPPVLVLVNDDNGNLCPRTPSNVDNIGSEQPRRRCFAHNTRLGN